MSRRTMLLLAIMATVLVTAASVAWAATINGNNADNTLKGTKKADRINGRGGDDTLLARRGRDQLIGGEDYLSGGFGDDEIFAQDGEPDEIRCGEGNDVAHYDPAPTTGGESPDTFLDGSCETIDDTVN